MPIVYRQKMILCGIVLSLALTFASSAAAFSLIMQSGETTLPGSAVTLQNPQAPQVANDGAVMFLAPTSEGAGVMNVMLWRDGDLITLVPGLGGFPGGGDVVQYNIGIVRGGEALYVYFRQAGSPADGAVGRYADGSYETIIPSVRAALNLSGSTQTYVMGLSAAENGSLAMSVADAIYPHFLVLYEDGSATILARESVTPVPGRNDTTFQNLVLPRIAPDASRVAFTGSFTGSSGDYVYVWNRSDSTISIARDADVTEFPGTDELIAAISSGLYGYAFDANGSLLFHAYTGTFSEREEEAILAYNADGSLTRRVEVGESSTESDVLTSLPTVFNRSNGLLFDGDGGIIFRANSTHIFRHVDGVLSRLVTHEYPSFNVGNVMLIDGDDLIFQAIEYTEDETPVLSRRGYYRVPVSGGEPSFLYDPYEESYHILDSYGDVLVVGNAENNPSRLLVARWSEIVDEQGLWKDAEHHPDNWRLLEPFGWFQEMGGGWIFHMEHGWLYATGETTQSFHLYDADLDAWLWMGISSYPWLYSYNPINSWLYYLIGGNPSERWFYHVGDDAWRSSAEL